MGGYPLLELVGVVAGHAYYFMQYVYPETNGRTLIQCPDFLYVHIRQFLKSVLYGGANMYI